MELVLYMDVGSRLRQLRKSKHLSERDLAELTAISQPVINRLENNARIADVDSLNRICAALGITLAEFFSDQAQGMPPEVRQILDKAHKLTPRQLKILNDVLDEWIEPKEK